MRHLREDSRSKEVQLLDGIKVFFGKDWVMAYQSHDHAYFHIVAEASTVEKAEELARMYAEKIKGWQG
ncbi:MAG: hypothetical protein HY878_03120 [Deltaproteobacteria bacterium]|nr:hypothetical protein [Deltaproteobacteria bacterium]